uniref:H6 family homeobox 1 n=1 Tax=Rhinopithecus bieti TaxID=61621 RepID=A0A2K6KVH9_RHIBE
PGRATFRRASSFLIGTVSAAQGDGVPCFCEDEGDDDRGRRTPTGAAGDGYSGERQLLAVTGPGGEARARALLGPGALGLGPRPPPGPGPPFALGCGGAARWYPRAHGGYGGGLSPDMNRSDRGSLRMVEKATGTGWCSHNMVEPSSAWIPE